MNIKKYKLFLLGLPKTLLFNLHYLPIKTALKLPVWLTHKVRLKSLKGKVIIEATQIRRGMISIGYAHVIINDVNVNILCGMLRGQLFLKEEQDLAREQK